MKIDIFQITQAEMRIMKILWTCKKPITTGELLGSLLKSDIKQAKPSSINNVCTRLWEKGFITYIQINGRNLYVPMIQKEDYQFLVAKTLIDTLFDGSAIELISSLLLDLDMSKDTLDAIQAMVKAAPLPSELLEQQQQAKNNPEPIESGELNAKELESEKEKYFVSDIVRPALFVIPSIMTPVGQPLNHGQRQLMGYTARAG